jgi:putative ATP-binding cassette transporter
LDIAKRVLQNCGQIMRYAVANDMTAHNPVAGVKPADVPTPPVCRRAVHTTLTESPFYPYYPRLDADEPWEQRLSTHEQQRLALARVLLQKPDWIVLDEATSDLDAATEAKVYEVLEQQVPNAALLAIAKRPGVLEHLPHRWALREGDGGRIALEAT